MCVYHNILYIYSADRSVMFVLRALGKDICIVFNLMVIALLCVVLMV